MHFPKRYKDCTYLCGAVNIPHLKGGGICPRKQTCLYWGGPTAMEAMGIESPEMCFPSWGKNRTYLCGPSNYFVSREAVHGVL